MFPWMYFIYLLAQKNDLIHSDCVPFPHLPDCFDECRQALQLMMNASSSNAMLALWRPILMTLDACVQLRQVTPIRWGGGGLI